MNPRPRAIRQKDDRPVAPAERGAVLRAAFRILDADGSGAAWPWAVESLYTAIGWH